MVSTRELRLRSQTTTTLYQAILNILDENSVDADVSFKVCEEVVVHYRRDMERLYATHHKQVHPTKHCSYLAFWIRKLKPISNAFPCSSIKDEEGNRPVGDEYTTINEQVSLFCALRSLHDYIAAGVVPLPGSHAPEQWLERYRLAVAAYLSSDVDAELSMGDRFESLVYDLRFRTFGPHHLTHTLTHILLEATHAGSRA